MEDCDRNRQTEDIIDVLNPSTDLLHCADNCTRLHRLMPMICSPGLIRNIRNLRAYASERSSNEIPIIYLVSRSEHQPTFMSLVDRGAIGCICGDDMRRISLTNQTIKVQGIDNHQLPGLAIGTFGATACTQRGNVTICLSRPWEIYPLIPSTRGQWRGSQRPSTNLSSQTIGTQSLLTSGTDSRTSICVHSQMMSLKTYPTSSWLVMLSGLLHNMIPYQPPTSSRSSVKPLRTLPLMCKEDPMPPRHQL